MASAIRLLVALPVCLILAAGSALAHDPHDPISVVAISPNFAQDHTVLAATGGLTIKLGVILLMKSTDGGINWTVVTGLMNNGNIYAVLFSPAYAQDQTILVAGAGGLFRSTNQGATWTTLTTTSLTTLGLSPNFANDNTLFAITSVNTIVESQNRGKTLTPIPSPGPLTAGLTTIAVSPTYATDHIVLVGSAADGIFKSASSGNSWSAVTANLVLPSVTSLLFSPSFSSDQTVFAGSLGGTCTGHSNCGGFLVSNNGGASWAQSNTNLTDLRVSAIALSPTFTQDSTLWVTTASAGVFKSTTRGASWDAPVVISRQLSGLTSLHYQTIAATGGGVQFMGAFEGLWTSSNTGASWNYIDICPTRTVRYIHLSPNFAQDQTVFASTYGSGNLWSTNGGLSWTFANTGMDAPYTDGSGISPNFAVDGIAFSGTHNGLLRSSDRGATWQPMTGSGAAEYPRGFAVSPNFAQDSTVFIGIEAAAGHHSGTGQQNSSPGLYISNDAGETWTLSSLSGVGITSIAFSPTYATDQTAFAASENGGVYRTTNAGVSWTHLTFSSQGMVVVAVSPNFAVDGVVFTASLKGGIYKTTDRGSNWSLIAQTKSVRALDIGISPHYAVDQTLYAGTIQSGLMKSTDGGQTLTTVASFPDVLALAIGISPNYQNDGTLFVYGYHGFYKSVDAGSTWTYLVAPSRIEESRNYNSSLQEPPSITYQGLWAFVSSPIASTTQYALTQETQDTAVLAFLGSGVRWVSWTGPNQGTATIALDGIPLGTVSLANGTDQLQQTVWEQHGIPCGNHTFTITALPQVTQTVSLDAFDVWIEECPYVDYGDAAQLGTTSITVGSAAGNAAVLLTTSGSWTATANAPWLSISSGNNSGSGSALIQFSFKANNNLCPITGTITIAGLTLTVTQAPAAFQPVDPVTSLPLSGLSGPQGVAVDRQGNVYIADTANNAIKEWTPGTGQLVSLVSSGLTAPAALALDAQGNIYIADTGANAIRKWSPLNQQLTTLVSAGLSGPSGVAVDAGGNVYFSDTGNNVIDQWNPVTQQVSPFVTGLSGPTGIAVDAVANLYFADTGNNAIKGWSAVTRQLVVLLATGLAGPKGVAVDGQDNVYIADTGNNSIKEVNAATLQLTVLASSGLNGPAGVATDAQGNVYIADRNNNAIEEITPAWVQLSTSSLNEPAQAGTDSFTAQAFPVSTILTATSDQPWLTITGISGGVIGLAYQASTSLTPRTAHVSVLGAIVTVTQAPGSTGMLITAGDGQTASLGLPFAVNLQVLLTDGGGNPLPGVPVTFTVAPGASGAAGSFSGIPPMPIDTGADGAATAPVLTANNTAGQFTVTAAAGSSSVTFTLNNTSTALGTNQIALGSAAGTGSVLLSASGPWTATSNVPWLSLVTGSASGTGGALIQFSYAANSTPAVQTGTLTIAGLTFSVTQAGSQFVPGAQLATLVSSGLNSPKGVAVDAQGNIYIADSANNVVKMLNAGSQQVTVLVPSGLNAPASVAVDALGDVYIADTNNDAIKEWVAATGQVNTLVSSGIYHPLGLAVDRNGNVYFSEIGRNTIRRWSPDSQKISTLISSGLTSPWGVAVDALGNLYIGDFGDNSLKGWLASKAQLVTLVATGLDAPRGVAVDGYGNVYIADTGHKSVQLWNAVTGQMTTLVSSGLGNVTGVAVDALDSVYFADASKNSVNQLSSGYLALGSTNLTEGSQAGTDSFSVQVLPTGLPLVLSSNRTWLTLTGLSNGSAGFSFTTNNGVIGRMAQITILGQSVTVTQNADVPASMQKTAGNGQSAGVGLPFATALQVKVKDASGIAVNGAPVTFTVVPGASGATATFAPAPPMPVLTNASGIATAPVLTAGPTAGSFTVTATSGTATATFSLTVTGP